MHKVTSWANPWSQEKSGKGCKMLFAKYDNVTRYTMQRKMIHSCFINKLIFPSISITCG